MLIPIRSPTATWYVVTSHCVLTRSKAVFEGLSLRGRALRICKFSSRFCESKSMLWFHKNDLKICLRVAYICIHQCWISFQEKEGGYIIVSKHRHYPLSNGQSWLLAGCFVSLCMEENFGQNITRSAQTFHEFGYCSEVHGRWKSSACYSTVPPFDL